jgi:hypothetical protein
METIFENLFESIQYVDGIVDVLFSDGPEYATDSQNGRITFRKAAEGIYGTMKSPITSLENGDVDFKVPWLSIRSNLEFCSFDSKKYGSVGT